MRIWLDTEFIEDGKTIELISLGAVREDGARFYAESAEVDLGRASDWVRANVMPHLSGGEAQAPRRDIAQRFESWCGERPEFWAYYADYDWVVLCQLYGRMIDLPKGWPKMCRDLAQLALDNGIKRLPVAKTGRHHNALDDALWCREAWEYLCVAAPR